MFSDVLRDLFHSGKGCIRVAAERFFGVPVATLPTAAVDFRGTLARTEGGAGVADRMVVCEKNTSDSYDWNDLGRAALDDRYVNVSGDTMTGDLSVTGTSPEISVVGSTAAFLTLRDTGATDDSEIVALVMDGGVAEVRLLNNNETLKRRPLRFGSAGNIVFNEDGDSGADFRMETDTISNAFELDASTDTVNVIDSAFRIRDNADNSKQAQFQASNITTATTRTYTLPNQSGGLAVTDSTAGVRVITGSVADDPPSTANGARHSVSVTVTGAAAGDPATCGHTTITAAGWRFDEAHVIAADTVRCSFLNNTGAPVDPGAGTASAIVFKAL